MKKSPAPSPKERELLLIEYSEAGQLSRQHELLTRTSAAVFVPMLTALLTYIFNAENSHGISLGILSIIGFLLSMLGINIIIRHKLYYKSCIKRLHKIEEKLTFNNHQVLQLYTKGKFVEKITCTFSNKDAFIYYFLIMAFMFLVKFILLLIG